ncbi:hypothetical protein PPK15_gp59 [Bacillus phage 000TH010]|uniref:Uncharacterized protein n=1 Tax=Bacillus phage 000TH010 TaxID=2601652 RepID=A0A5P8PHR9_9CAUD|nr:hypothetical protein PPK15_gp59 [Bacillus phage 000TH010]QFR56272.1 hypothetical protein 000TH010_59 [Bacillus phage 000TH010]
MFDRRIVTKDQKSQLVSLLGSDNVNAVRSEVKFKVISDIMRENYDIDGMSKQEAVDCIVHGFKTPSPVEELINDLNVKIEYYKQQEETAAEIYKNNWRLERQGLSIALTMILERQKELEEK